MALEKIPYVSLNPDHYYTLSGMVDPSSGGVWRDVYEISNNPLIPVDIVAFDSTADPIYPIYISLHPPPYKVTRYPNGSTEELYHSGTYITLFASGDISKADTVMYPRNITSRGLRENRTGNVAIPPNSGRGGGYGGAGGGPGRIGP